MERSALSPLETSELVSVTLMAGTVGAHVGILFRANDQGSLSYVSLEFHHALKVEGKAPDDAIRLVCSVPMEAQSDVRAIARRFSDRYRKDGKVPYAFAVEDATITGDGSLTLGRSLGLTCATMVLALFSAANVQLIEHETWNAASVERRAEDAAAQTKLVGYLRHYDADHAKLVEATIGCTRFRAEEVAAASAGPSIPAPFSVAAPAGAELLARVSGC